MDDDDFDLYGDLEDSTPAAQGGTNVNNAGSVESQGAALQEKGAGGGGALKDPLENTAAAIGSHVVQAVQSHAPAAPAESDDGAESEDGLYDMLYGDGDQLPDSVLDVEGAKVEEEPSGFNVLEQAGPEECAAGPSSLKCLPAEPLAAVDARPLPEALGVPASLGAVGAGMMDAIPVAGSTAAEFAVEEEEDSDSEDDLDIIVTDKEPVRPMLAPPPQISRVPAAVVDGAEDDEEEEEDDFQIILGNEEKPAEEQTEWNKETPGVEASPGVSGKDGWGQRGSFKYVRTGAEEAALASPSAARAPASAAGAASALPPLPAGQRPQFGHGAQYGRGAGDQAAGRGAARGLWSSQAAAGYGRGLSGGDYPYPTARTVFEVDLDTLDDKPWRRMGANLADYFNYEFNEKTWKEYCTKIAQLKLESTMQSKIRVYESGRADQEHDPDLPPELLAARGGSVPDDTKGHPGPSTGRGGSYQGSELQKRQAEARRARARDSEAVIQVLLHDDTEAVEEGDKSEGVVEAGPNEAAAVEQAPQEAVPRREATPPPKAGGEAVAAAPRQEGEGQFGSAAHWGASNGRGGLWASEGPGPPARRPMGRLAMGVGPPEAAMLHMNGGPMGMRPMYGPPNYNPLAFRPPYAALGGPRPMFPPMGPLGPMMPYAADMPPMDRAWAPPGMGGGSSGAWEEERSIGSAADRPRKASSSMRPPSRDLSPATRERSATKGGEEEVEERKSHKRDKRRVVDERNDEERHEKRRRHPSLEVDGEGEHDERSWRRGRVGKPHKREGSERYSDGEAEERRRLGAASREHREAEQQEEPPQEPRGKKESHRRHSRRHSRRERRGQEELDESPEKLSRREESVRSQDKEQRRKRKASHRDEELHEAGRGRAEEGAVEGGDERAAEEQEQSGSRSSKRRRQEAGLQVEAAAEKQEEVRAAAVPEEQPKAPLYEREVEFLSEPEEVEDEEEEDTSVVEARSHRWRRPPASAKTEERADGEGSLGLSQHLPRHHHSSKNDKKQLALEEERERPRAKRRSPHRHGKEHSSSRPAEGHERGRGRHTDERSVLLRRRSRGASLYGDAEGSAGHSSYRGTKAHLAGRQEGAPRVASTGQARGAREQQPPVFQDIDAVGAQEPPSWGEGLQPLSPLKGEVDWQAEGQRSENAAETEVKDKREGSRGGDGKGLVVGRKEEKQHSKRRHKRKHEEDASVDEAEEAQRKAEKKKARLERKESKRLELRAPEATEGRATAQAALNGQVANLESRQARAESNADKRQQVATEACTGEEDMRVKLERRKARFAAESRDKEGERRRERAAKQQDGSAATLRSNGSRPSKERFAAPENPMLEVARVADEARRKLGGEEGDDMGAEELAAEIQRSRLKARELLAQEREAQEKLERRQARFAGGQTRSSLHVTDRLDDRRPTNHGALKAAEDIRAETRRTAGGLKIFQKELAAATQKDFTHPRRSSGESSGKRASRQDTQAGVDLRDNLAGRSERSRKLS